MLEICLQFRHEYFEIRSFSTFPMVFEFIFLLKEAKNEFVWIPTPPEWVNQYLYHKIYETSKLPSTKSRQLWNAFLKLHCVHSLHIATERVEKFISDQTQKLLQIMFFLLPNISTALRAELRWWLCIKQLTVAFATPNSFLSNPLRIFKIS